MSALREKTTKRIAHNKMFEDNRSPQFRIIPAIDSKANMQRLQRSAVTTEAFFTVPWMPKSPSVVTVIQNLNVKKFYHSFTHLIFEYGESSLAA